MDDWVLLIAGMRKTGKLVQIIQGNEENTGQKNILQTQIWTAQKDVYIILGK